MKAVHTDRLVAAAARNREFGALPVRGLNLGQIHAVHNLAILYRELQPIQTGILPDPLHIAVVGGGVEAPGNNDEGKGHGIALLQGRGAQVKGKAISGILSDHDKSRVAIFASDGEVGIVYNDAKVGVVVAEGIRGGVEIVQGNIRELIAQLSHDGIGFGVDNSPGRLVVLVQIAQLSVGPRISFQRIEGKILGEISNGDVLQNLVADLIVSAKLVGLGQLHVVVGDLDAAIIRDIVHLHVGINGARRLNMIVVVLAGRIVTIGIGVLQEVLVARMGMLRLIVKALTYGQLEPVGHGHGTEIGESPEVACTVERADAAGLGHAQRKMVVGPEELN